MIDWLFGNGDGVFLAGADHWAARHAVARGHEARLRRRTLPHAQTTHQAAVTFGPVHPLWPGYTRSCPSPLSDACFWSSKFSFFGWAREVINILLLRDSETNFCVCDRGSNKTLGSVFSKCCTQIWFKMVAILSI